MTTTTIFWLRIPFLITLAAFVLLLVWIFVRRNS